MAVKPVGVLDREHSDVILGIARAIEASGKPIPFIFIGGVVPPDATEPDSKAKIEAKRNEVASRMTPEDRKTFLACNNPLPIDSAFTFYEHCKSKREDEAWKLIESKDISPTEHYGDLEFTLLHIASNWGCEKLAAKLVVWEGINVNAVSFSGKTAAHYAVKSLNVELIHLLKRAGVNFFTKDHSGSTPMSTIALTTEKDRLFWDSEACTSEFKEKALGVHRAITEDKTLWPAHIVALDPPTVVRSVIAKAEH